MNIVTLTGNVVRDIELTYTPSGVSIAKGTIAVKRSYKDKQTENYESDFINFVMIGKRAETLANYVKKGDSFGISGSLEIKKHNDKYYTNVVVNDFDFPNRKKNNVMETPSKIGTLPSNRLNDPFANDSKTIDISDDDLPF